MNVVKSLLYFLFVLAISATFYHQLEQLKQVPKVDQRVIKESSESDFFADLMRLDLLRLANDLYIETPTADEALLCGAENRWNDEQKELLGRLYSTNRGKVIRRHIQQWNSAHRVAAIRDNRGDGSAWEVVSEDPNRRLTPGHYLSEGFGFILGDTLQPGFADWTVVGGDGRARFSKTFTVTAPTRVVIQLIGHAVHPDQKSALIEQRTFCPSAQQAGEAAACGRRAMQGTVLTYQLSSGQHRLSFSLDTVSTRERRVPGLAISIAQGEALLTSRTPPPRRSEAAAFTITTHDGVRLTGLHGAPNDAAWKLGLVPVTGLHQESSYALSWLLNRSGFQGDARLTIDAALQRIVNDQLHAHLQQLHTNWRAADGAQEARVQAKRRAAVVLLNANSGAIVAVAGAPTPPVGVSNWDVAAFATKNDAANPLRMSAWHYLDSRFAPGSTFKPATVLSAIRRNDPSINAYLKGYPLNQFEQMTGMSPQCAAYVADYRFDETKKTFCFKANSIPTIALANFRSRSGYENFARKLGRDGGQTIGVQQAVRYSINNWFIHLAMMMDGQATYHYDQAARRTEHPAKPPLALLATARELGFDEGFMDLGWRVGDAIRSPCRKEGATVPCDLLLANSGQLSMAHGKSTIAPNILAQNSIGQGVAASPLQMARTAASIAVNQRIRPYLIEPLNGALTPPDGPPLADAQRLAWLIAGMKAVPQKGTAKAAFVGYPALAGLYGKTGTADVPGNNGNSAWFIGWQEGVQLGPNASDQVPLAFACMVSNAHGDIKDRTGGGVCAPLIRSVLDAIAARESASKEHSDQSLTDDPLAAPQHLNVDTTGEQP